MITVLAPLFTAVVSLLLATVAPAGAAGATAPGAAPEFALAWWQAVILGVVEGITEYLPVSSTGHLILASELMQLGETVDAYNIVIQGGAILAVLGLYRARVATMIQGLLGRHAAGRRLAINLIIAFLPAALLGPLLDDVIEAHLFSAIPVLAALAVGGIVMIGLTPWQRRHFAGADDDAERATDGAPDAPDTVARTTTDANQPASRDSDAPERSGVRRYVDIESLTWKAALLIGLLQCVAMWPGTSRSMMTIVAGMLVGLRPKHAAEFSFLLGLPTLGGACAFKLAKDLLGSEPSTLAQLGLGPALIGIAVATVSAALAVKWLVGYLQRHGVALFGWYRLALAAVLAVLWATGVISIG